MVPVISPTLFWARLFEAKPIPATKIPIKIILGSLQIKKPNNPNPTAKYPLREKVRKRSPEHPDCLQKFSRCQRNTG
jgi:hypothetical protein